MPVVIAVVMSAYVFVYVIWLHRDFVDYVTLVGRLDKLVFSAIAMLCAAMLHKFHKEISFADIGLRKCVLAGLAFIFSSSAILLPALPPGTTRDISAMVAVSSLLGSMAWLLSSMTIVSAVSLAFNPQDGEYPPRASAFPWVIDFVMWMLLSIAAFVTVGIFASFYSEREEGSPPLYPWIVAAIICFVYQSVGTSAFGGTVGQRVFGVKIIKQGSGECLSLPYSSFRTLVATAPALAIFALFYLNSIESIPHANGIRYYSAYIAIVVFLLGLIVGGFSVTLIRSEHPRGQGIVDLLLRTISVPVDGETKSRISAELPGTDLGEPAL